jgi:MFS family permease
MRRNINLFYSYIFFQHFAFGIIIPTFIIWQSQSGLTYGEIGLIQSIGLIFLIGLEIPSSFFADKIGRKITLLLGIISIICAFITIIAGVHFFNFLLFQILFNSGLAFLSGTEETFLHDIVVDNASKLTKNLGSMSIADEYGTIIGMVVSSLIIANSNLINSYYIAAIALFFSLGSLMLIKTNSIISNLYNSPNIKKLFSKLNMSLILIVIAFGLFSERGEMIYQRSFQQIGFQFDTLGIVYLASKFFAISGSKLAHCVENKFNTIIPLIAATAIQLIAFVLLFGDGPIWVILSLCIFSFAENLFRNIKSSFILKNSQYSKRATNISLVSFGSSIMLVFTKLIIGNYIDQQIKYAIYFVIVIKLIALCILIYESPKKHFINSIGAI